MLGQHTLANSIQTRPTLKIDFSVEAQKIQNPSCLAFFCVRSIFAMRDVMDNQIEVNKVQDKIGCREFYFVFCSAESREIREAFCVMTGTSVVLVTRNFAVFMMNRLEFWEL